jgi:arginyl-tRNA synthetase
VFRQASDAFPGQDAGLATLAAADLSVLTDEAEVELQRRIAQYPRIVEAAALAHEPHRIAFYLYDLAGVFHALWNKGKDLPQLRFVKHDDERSTLARLALLGALKAVLASGLGTLGVSAPDEMR